MSAKPSSTGPLPVVPFLKIPADGDPYLEGHRCDACDAVFLGPRTVCSKCGSRDEMQARPLSNTGTLYTYSIVHRSFPGIDVPYVSAVVDLDGGGTLKGNLVQVQPAPEHVKLGMAVDVIYGDALGRTDRDGNRYLSYFFRPRA